MKFTYGKKQLLDIGVALFDILHWWKWENDYNMRHKNYNPRKGIYIWLVEYERIYDSVNVFMTVWTYLL